MARVTVEDCIEKVDNRFELVMLASQRARKIGSGAPLLVDRDNDKNPVVALREIADEQVETADLKEELIRNHQRIIESDDTEDVIDTMDGEADGDWSAIAAQYADSEMSERDFDDDDGDEDFSSLGSLAGGEPMEEDF